MNLTRFFVLLIVACSPLVATAENIDLSTVPSRDGVQLTIYNSEDLTLVRETRKVTFKKGINPLQFSWAETLIDPTSVELKFVTNGEKLSLVDTTFPHAKPKMLYWNVQSDFDGEASIEITYFTSGIRWAADYVAIANPAEDAVKLEGFVEVKNESGEDYEGAQVRLVVGQINLVQAIADLAQITVAEAKEMEAADKDKYNKLKEDSAKRVMEEAAPQAGLFSDSGGSKQIAKEGLGEYFIFTVEGTETIPNGWSKRMRAIEADGAPVKVQYRYRPRMYEEKLMRVYLLTNNKESKLGGSPLPDGLVQVLRDNGRDGLSYIGTQEIKYIPIGDKIEVPVGEDPQVVFELIKLRTFRNNIWMSWNGGQIIRRVDDGAIAVDLDATVVGWDDHEVFTQRIRNYTGKAIEVEVERTLGGHVVFRSNLSPKLYDFQTPVFTTTVAAGEKKDHLFEVLRHQGHNAKMDNVTLEKAEITR